MTLKDYVVNFNAVEATVHGKRGEGGLPVPRRYARSNQAALRTRQEERWHAEIMPPVFGR